MVRLGGAQDTKKGLLQTAKCKMQKSKWKAGEGRTVQSVPLISIFD